MAISALTSMPNASGKLSAMFAAMVPGFGEVSSVEGDHRRGREHHGDRHRLAERAAEAEHRRRDTMPERPKGSTAMRIISQRVAPRASAASSCSRGACRKTSRLTR